MSFDELRDCRFLERRAGYDGISNDIKRIGSEYYIEDWFTSESVFSPSDAISLALLAARESVILAEEHQGWIEAEGRREYYSLAYNAVVRSLNLSDSDRLPSLLDKLARKFPSSRCESASAQLLRVRCLLISFQNEYGNMIEGDRWCTSPSNPFKLMAGGRPHPFEPLSAEHRLAMEKVQSWYYRRADELMEEVRVIDEGLCLLFGWDPKNTIPFRLVREKFEYPSVSKFAEEFMALT